MTGCWTSGGAAEAFKFTWTATTRTVPRKKLGSLQVPSMRRRQAVPRPQAKHTLRCPPPAWRQHAIFSAMVLACCAAPAAAWRQSLQTNDEAKVYYEQHQKTRLTGWEGRGGGHSGAQQRVQKNRKKRARADCARGQGGTGNGVQLTAGNPGEELEPEGKTPASGQW